MEIRQSKWRGGGENIKEDFQRIAIKNHEEVTKLIDKQRDYVPKIVKELLTVAKPVVPTTTSQVDESILNILMNDEESV